MTTLKPSLRPLRLPIDWDAGAPSPILVQDGSLAAVAFYAARAPTGSPNEVQLASPGKKVGGVGVVRLFGCYGTRLGTYGWDEIRKHPLWGLGLARFPRDRAFEVVSSRWLAEYRGFRGDSSLRHLALFFPDATMEFLAEDLVAHMEWGTVHEILVKQLRAFEDETA